MADYEICMYVGYHDANNVSTFDGDSVTQLKKIENDLKNVYAVLPARRDAATGFAAAATRPRAGCWSMEDRHHKSLILKCIANRHNTIRDEFTFRYIIIGWRFNIDYSFQFNDLIPEYRINKFNNVLLTQSL